jgi:hypothetical protein
MEAEIRLDGMKPFLHGEQRTVDGTMNLRATCIQSGVRFWLGLPMSRDEGTSWYEFGGTSYFNADGIGEFLRLPISEGFEYADGVQWMTRTVSFPRARLIAKSTFLSAFFNEGIAFERGVHVELSGANADISEFVENCARAGS